MTDDGLAGKLRVIYLDWRRDHAGQAFLDASIPQELLDKFAAHFAPALAAQAAELARLTDLSDRLGLRVRDLFAEQAEDRAEIERLKAQHQYILDIDLEHIDDFMAARMAKNFARSALKGGRP